MLRTTAGQVLINEALPVELRDYNRVLNKKGTQKLLQEVAEKHSDKYRDIAKRLFDIGHLSAYTTGGQSFGLKHLKVARSAKQVQQELAYLVQKIMTDGRLKEDEKEKRVLELVYSRQGDIEKMIMEESKAENNPLYEQVDSGSRGNPMNLKTLRGGDGIYQDHHDNLIPIPVLRSYSQGLSPVEYWAGTFGARKGVQDVKFATQDAGAFSKQLNQLSHRLLVTAYDADNPSEISERGLPVDTDDSDNEGALLAFAAGPYKRNTILTPKILSHLKELGVERVVVRSPIVSGSPEGGVYANDVGIREKGRIAPLSDNVGLAAAQALSEPLSQSQLSSKHSGGIAGAAKGVSGFKYVNQLVQVPKRFKGGAAHSQVDGVVEDISEAPAGGYYVTIGGERHYVAAGYDLKIKRGDEIEAGDVISEGIPNPAEVVAHKGIGEGKRYFLNAFRSAYKDSGLPAHRRNVELLTRGLINHVKMSDEYGDYSPDEIVPYSILENSWQPRADHQILAVNKSKNKYLERPVLHYSIGTKIRPSVMRELQSFGIKNIAVHDQAPPFEPEMIRGMNNLSHDPDWMTRMLGSNLQKSLLSAAHHGAVSNDYGTSYVPGLSKATEFGRRGFVRDWHDSEAKFKNIGKVIP